MAKHYLEFRIALTDEERDYFLKNRVETAELVGVSSDEDDGEAPETDKNGVAWSKDFHSNPAKLNADGTWRRRKNLSAEDKAAADAYEAAKPVAPVEPVAVPAVEPVAVPAPSVGLPGAAPAAPAVGLPGFPAPVAAVAPAPIAIEDVIAKLNELHGKGGDPILSHVQTVIYPKIGLTDVNALNTDETMRRKLFDELSAL